MDGEAGGIDDASLIITENPKNGSCVILSNKNIIYTPFPGFSGQDNFYYQVSDKGYPLPAKSGSAKVAIDIARLSPEANDDQATGIEDSDLLIDLLMNDVDNTNDIDPSTVRIVGNPLHGTLSLSGNGKVIYKPLLNFNGDDTFTYTVKDQINLTSNLATVS